jgi:hypothetical protein
MVLEISTSLHFVSQVPSQATAPGSGAECADFGFTRCHSVSRCFHSGFVFR